MGLGSVIYLIVQGGVFLAWAFLMFRALFGLLRRSVAVADQAGDGFVGWVGHSLRLFFGYFSEPTVAQERRVLIIVTGILIAMTIGSIFVMGPNG